MAYRSYYKKPSRTLEQTKYTLTSELHRLQEDLRELQERSSSHRPYSNNYFELDKFLTNKLILIGGCILLGVGIAYFLFNPNRNRCK